MRAVTYAGVGAVEVIEIADPRILVPTDALLEVHRAAVCGTDLHTINHPDGVDRGAVLGHEYAGKIIEAGSAVQRFGPGDRVSGADFTACGHCWWCRGGNHWECAESQFFGTGAAFGPALAGTQAEFVRVPYADVVLQPIASGQSYDTALFHGDILATAYAAVQRASFSPGATVVVVGGGPVGQLTSLVAQSCSAGPVIVVEPVAQRREFARDHGALIADPDTARGVIDAITDGRGADAVIDAVGGPRGLETAFTLVRRRGAIVSVGVHQQATWAMPVARAFADELTVSFAIGDGIRDHDPISALVAAQIIDPTVLIDNRVSIADAASGYAAMAARRTLKTVIDVI